MAHMGVDLSDAQAMSFDPVPAGEYTVVVDDTDVKESKNGNPYVKVRFSITGPTHQNRKIFENFMLSHDVGKSRLKTFAECSGHTNPNRIEDSEELHDLECKVLVTVEEGKDGYDAQNRIVRFSKLPASPLAQQPAKAPSGSGFTVIDNPPLPTPPAPQPQAAPAPKPWEPPF